MSKYIPQPADQKRFFRFLQCFLMSIIFIGTLHVSSAQAVQSEWAVTDHLQARFMSSVETNAADSFDTALDVRLSDGWYGYWKMPGEGGLPPEFDWSGSENLKAADVMWPAPERYVVADMHSFVYKGKMFLPVRIQPEDTSKDVKLHLKAAIMVCKQICVPQSIEMQLDIPAGAEKASSYAPQIDHAVSRLPSAENLPGLKIEHLVVGPKAIVITTFAQRGYDYADVFVESGDIYLVAEPVIEKDQDDPRKAIISVPYPEFMDDVQSSLMAGSINIVLTDGRDAIERHFQF